MLVVNLYGGPCAGKSTIRADVFRRLKQMGINCEENTEFAKQLTWEKRHLTLTCQPYVFGKQLRNMEILRGQVDVVITDSPLLLSRLYGERYGDYPCTFYQAITDIAKSFSSLNYFINRAGAYQPIGRNQTEEEAAEVAADLKAMLTGCGIDYREVLGDHYAGAEIVVDVVAHLAAAKGSKADAISEL